MKGLVTLFTERWKSRFTVQTNWTNLVTVARIEIDREFLESMFYSLRFPVSLENLFFSIRNLVSQKTIRYNKQRITLETTNGEKKKRKETFRNNEQDKIWFARTYKKIRTSNKKNFIGQGLRWSRLQRPRNFNLQIEKQTW